MSKDNIQEEWEKGTLIAPMVNIYETGNHFLLMANMPGVKKGDVDVKIKENQLIIFGRVEPIKDELDRMIHQEIEEGNYYRAFRVGDTINVNTINAKFENSVLMITMPKHERLKPKKIPIEIM